MSEFEKMLASEHLPKVGTKSVSLGQKGNEQQSNSGNPRVSAKPSVKIKRIKGRKSAKELPAKDQID